VGTIQDANQVIRTAEAALRSLLEQAVREHRYADVAAIAPLADSVAKLLRATAPLPAPSSTLSPPPQAAPTGRKAARPTYPRFLRDGDKLVKIGWSKKSREEYEHRAPLAVATSLLAAIRSKVRDGELFAATDVIPHRVGDDAMPDYQAYLALKWFHSEGIVTKHPRDRYSVEPGRIGPSGLDEYWLRLPTAKGSKSGGSK
jgi:hypothetical protein